MSHPLPGVQALLEVMAKLRDPEGGCPWDLEQDLDSLRAYCLEEAYEVVEAIHGGSPAKLKEELGDLLLQIVFQSRIAEERSWFTFDAVAQGIADKMIRRHPHVFGSDEAEDAAAVVRSWELIKAEERGGAHVRGALDGVPDALPALLKALRVSEKAAAVGFDWQDAAGVEAKLEEEWAELQEAWARQDRGAMEHELGDFLLAAANLARHLGLDAEAALHRAVGRFRRRFEHMEARAHDEARPLRDRSSEELEALWQAAKAELQARGEDGPSA